MHEDRNDTFTSEDERQPAHSIFVLDDKPIPIFLHPSLSRGGSWAMARKIEDAGGNPYATEKEARVIICRYDTPIFRELEFVYDHERYKWVEPPSWVDTCIDLGKYKHYSPSKDTRRRLNSKTPFSIEDDEHLVKFLAHRIPYKELGGRLGNGVYKDLCSDRRASLYPWAKHHPWQSWRDRYSKNQDIFDARITYKVMRQPDPPMPGGKGQYMIPRKTRKPLPLRYNVEVGVGFDDDEFEEEEGQEVQFRQTERWKQLDDDEEDEEEEEEDDEVVDSPHTTTKKRSRPTSNFQDGRTERSQQFSPPPRKQPRISVVPSNSEDGASAGMGQDKGKGKGRQLPPDSEFERREQMEPNDPSFSAMYDDYEPGPSQYRVRNVDTTMKSSEVNVANRPEPEAVSLPLLNVSDVRASAAQAALPQVPPDSQMTLVAPTQKHPERNTAPIDTRAPIVPSPPRHASERPQRAARKEASRKSAQKTVAYNTRSRRPPEGKFFQLGIDKQVNSNIKRPRGRPRKTQNSHVSVQPQHGSTSAINLSLREEVQVEEILQIPEEKMSQEPLEGDRDGDSSSSEGFSSEDDEAARMLRTANKQMINEGARSRSTPRKIPAASKQRQAPFINISRQAARPSRRLTVLRESSTIARRTDPDPDATLKAQPPNARKAAKKTAARGPPSNQHDSDSDLQSGTTTTTGSSFPVEMTNAREYLNAQSRYNPAPGTKAEEHIRDEKRKSRQGSRRAR